MSDLSSIDVRKEMLTGFEQRHPTWIGRLETEDYHPIALVNINDLRPGDIIDIRTFFRRAKDPDPFLEIREIESDNQGVITVTGMLSNGQFLEFHRRDGVRMRRRRIVRFGRRMPI